MRPRLRTLIATATFTAALGIAPAASAQTGATTYFSDYDRTLVDLNPGDGIDPAISFDGSSVIGSTYFYDTPYATTPPRYAVSNSSIGHVSFGIFTDGVWLSTDATPTSGNAVLGIPHGSATLQTVSTDNFVLAPYTQVTFTIYGSVSEATIDGSTASGNLTLTGMLRDLDGSVILDRDGFSSDAGPTSGTLSVTLRTGANQLYGSVEFRSDLSARVLSPVPEPTSAGMLALGLGLGLIGLAARRRARRAGGAALAIAAALGIAPAASAQSEATAQFGDFTYTLVDLNPSDGIGPRVDFYGTSSRLTAEATFHTSPDGSGLPRDQISDSVTDGFINLSIDAPGAYLTTESYQTSGSATNRIQFGSSVLTTNAFNTFILSPYTEVTFTVNGTVGELNSAGNNSSALLAMIGKAYYTNGDMIEHDAGLSSDSGPSYGPLSLTFRAGADDLPVTLEFNTTLTAQVLSPVPEPAMGALLVAGLGIVGARIRRRPA